jgi:hypothetical protein
VIEGAVARSKGMNRASGGLALALFVIGCAADEGRTPRRVPDPPPAGAAAISSARARLSVATHRGADSLSGLRIEGTCAPGTVRVEVGHAPPYKPLRDVGDPRIDRIKVFKRASLNTGCQAGRFTIKRRHLSLRLGEGPLKAKSSAGGAVAVRIKTFGIE